MEELLPLVRMMSRLPGLGPRSASRAVLHLVKKKETLLVPLAEELRRVGAGVRECAACKNFCAGEKCAICLSEDREADKICVVQEVSDLWALERSGAFKGRYHVLGGALSPLDSVTPESLGIPALVSRVSGESVQEVILALNATMEGQATAHYIADQLESLGVKTTALALGVPVGGELEFLDDGTISAALSARKDV